MILKNLSMTYETFAPGITPRDLIQLAYGVDDRQIAGAPDWLGSERFDINAKVNGAAAVESGKPGGDQRDPENRRRLQALLADHFKLALHRETRDVPVYALVAAPNGPRLHEARPGDTYPDGDEMYGRKGAGLIHLEPDQITGQGVPLSSLTGVLSRRLGRTVLDRTGLKGNYDFKLHWNAAVDASSSPESSAPAIIAAVQEQMGLKVEAQTIPLETLVIDHVEQPSLPQARNTAMAPGFEVALIKENTTGEPMPPFHIVGKPFVAYMFKSDRFMATNATLFQLLQRAYSIESDQVAGGPDWTKSVPYDVDFKPDKSSLDALQKLSQDEQLSEWKRALQTLFKDRFKLALHRETRELPVYALVIVPNGSKLKEAKPGDTYPDGVKRNDGRPQGHGLWVPGPGQLAGQGVSLAMLKGVLSSRLGGRVVLDKTGLTGNYDFTLHWTPAEGGADSSAAILAAIQELGLKLEPQKAPMEVLVIDHAEKPAER